MTSAASSTHPAAWPHADCCTSSVQGRHFAKDTSGDEETVSDDSEETESDDESDVISSMAARQGQGGSAGSLYWAAPVITHSSRTPYMDTRLPAPTHPVAQWQQQQQGLAAPADTGRNGSGDQAASGTAYHGMRRFCESQNRPVQKSRHRTRKL